MSKKKTDVASAAARSACCPNGSCARMPELSRRQFLKLSANTAAGAMLVSHANIALALGVSEDELVLVPADKNLSPEWLRSLAARGAPTVYSSAAALRHIGMPVGGVTTGQVYLGGDGRLWLWDIYNAETSVVGGHVFSGPHYVDPETPTSPFHHGFALQTRATGKTITRSLNIDGFSDIRFTGQYPMGRVEYRSDACPVQVTLEAFSPFIPLDVDDSSLPATVLAYTATNTSPHRVAAEIAGWSESPICLESRNRQPIQLRSRVLGGSELSGVDFSATGGEVSSPQPDIVFDDFERDSYTGWTVEGSAFGDGPVTVAELPSDMKRSGDLHVHGKRLVTSHNFRAGGNSQAADNDRGKLTSRSFTIERRYIHVSVGGGDYLGETCVNVVVGGKAVASATGANAEPLLRRSFDVSRLKGGTAVIEIVDNRQGSWGHVNCDYIVFSDRPLNPKPLNELPDAGTFTLVALDQQATVNPSLTRWDTAEDIFSADTDPVKVNTSARTIAGAVRVPVELHPGESRTIRFVIGWYFPVTRQEKYARLRGAETLKRHYATRFDSASDVINYVASHLYRLEGDTRKWVKTWYADSTLPHWFLERTLANASTLATSTCHRFDNGRFYGWEGVFCCPGTCEHVWNYAQSVARLFPMLERDTRERVDLGIAFNADGALDYRAEYDRRVAADGQCGTILRVYREHQMSADDAFLQRVWRRLKKAAQYMIRQDGQPEDGQSDGILEDSQYNTLDSTWYGEIPWISGLYVAALRAAEEMAIEVGDSRFADRCHGLAEIGSAYLSTALWNDKDGYFIQRLNPQHPGAINSNRGCYIDQLYGQTYAAQLNLPRVFPADKNRIALQNLFRYNFTPDAAAYRKVSKIPGGRVFATSGEAGLLMCTWPFGGAKKAPGKGQNFAVGYFNENWTGTEYQAAAGMLSTGLVEEGLAVTRAVHDRYDAAKRNPYNEIECSDHYARAMMSHGVYLAACGYEYHGPKGHLEFAPKIRPEHFSAAFTAAEGWGLYRQRQHGDHGSYDIELRHGRLRLNSLAFDSPRQPSRVDVHIAPPRRLRYQLSYADGRLQIQFGESVMLESDQTLHVKTKNEESDKNSRM